MKETSWDSISSGKVAKHAVDAALRYNGPVPHLERWSEELVTDEERAELASIQKHLDKLDTQSQTVCGSARRVAVKQRNKLLLSESVSDNYRRDLLSGEELELQMRDRHDATKQAIPLVQHKARKTLVAIAERIAKFAAGMAREAVDSETPSHEDVSVPYAPSNVVKAWHKVGEKMASFADKHSAPHISGEYRTTPPPVSFFRPHGLMTFEPLTEAEIDEAIDELKIDIQNEGAA